MRRSIVTVLPMLALIALLPAGALAYLVAAGTGTAAASVTALTVPGSPAASGGSTVTVTWSAASIGSTAATSYTVERYTSTGTDLGPASCSPVPSSSGTPNALGNFTCTDSPAAGTYEYKITAIYASWSSSTGFTGTATVPARNATATTLTAPASDTAGTAIAASAISAALSGASSGAGGTVSFMVFGPQASAPTTCTSGGTQIGAAVTVSGNATYHPSASYTPATAGTYWFYASYSGDANNAASSSPCGAGMPSTVAWSLSSAASATDTATHNSTASSSFAVAPNTTYLLFVFRHSASSDAISSITSSGLSPSLSLASFTSIALQSYNTADYQWAYYLTTAAGASGTGTLTVTFNKTLGPGQVTVLDLVKLQGNSLTAPIVTANKATGSSNTASANLPSAPASGDASAVFLSTSASAGRSAPAATPAMTSLFYAQQPPGSAGIYGAVPGQQNESLGLGSSQSWGTIAIELARG